MTIPQCKEFLKVRLLLDLDELPRPVIEEIETKYYNNGLVDIKLMLLEAMSLKEEKVRDADEIRGNSLATQTLLNGALVSVDRMPSSLSKSSMTPERIEEIIYLKCTERLKNEQPHASLHKMFRDPDSADSRVITKNGMRNVFSKFDIIMSHEEFDRFFAKHDRGDGKIDIHTLLHCLMPPLNADANPFTPKDPAVVKMEFKLSQVVEEMTGRRREVSNLNGPQFTRVENDFLQMLNPNPSVPLPFSYVNNESNDPGSYSRQIEMDRIKAAQESYTRTRELKAPVRRNPITHEPISSADAPNSSRPGSDRAEYPVAMNDTIPLQHQQLLAAAGDGSASNSTSRTQSRGNPLLAQPTQLTEAMMQAHPSEAQSLADQRLAYADTLMKAMKDLSELTSPQTSPTKPLSANRPKTAPAPARRHSTSSKQHQQHRNNQETQSPAQTPATSYTAPEPSRPKSAASERPAVVNDDQYRLQQSQHLFALAEAYAQQARRADGVQEVNDPNPHLHHFTLIKASLTANPCVSMYLLDFTTASRGLPSKAWTRSFHSFGLEQAKYDFIDTTASSQCVTSPNRRVQHDFQALKVDP